MNLIESVIAAFHQHIRQQSRDQTSWRDVVKDGYVVHTPQRREYLGSLRFIENRTIRSLQLTHRAVAVYRHQQNIPKRARLRQITHVPNVQQIKNAVRKNESPARSTQILALPEHLLRANNFRYHYD
jgi:hypothetical protein